jgi:Protein of unknown function (DUF1566)
VKRGRPLRLLALLAGTLAAASLARADAPPGQYAPYDQSATTITDNFTHLTWQRYAPSQPFAYAGAASFCASIPVGNGISTRWRSPSYKELLTLVDESPHVDFVTGARVAIDPNAFPQTAVDRKYVTSSLSPQSASVYVVDFGTGIVSFAAPGDQSYYVRCVTP